MLMLPLLFAWGACSEGEELPENNELKLPALSQEGKQYLACLVNGELFLSNLSGGWGNNNKPVAGIFYDSILFIYGADYESMKGAFLGLSQLYIKGKKTYTLDYKNFNYRTWFTDNSPLGGNQYKLLESEPHQMEIHYEDENIIAGTFFFSAVSELGDTVRITDGRFDLKKGI